MIQRTELSAQAAHISNFEANSLAENALDVDIEGFCNSLQSSIKHGFAVTLFSLVRWQCF